MLFCWERKKQHLTILVYVSYFLCVYCAQCDVLCDFCMKWFCCSMKTKTIVPSVFGVCVNFKIRTFQWSAVQWWDGAGKGMGWKTAAIIYCWQQQHVCGQTAQLLDISSGATCVADLDSGALALTKEASGNICDTRTHPPTNTHTHTFFFWLTNNLKHSINYNKTKFLKQQNTKIETLNWPQHINYRQHLWSNILS